jgi:hypothetical protein
MESTQGISMERSVSLAITITIVPLTSKTGKRDEVA